MSKAVRPVGIAPPIAHVDTAKNVALGTPGTPAGRVVRAAALASALATGSPAQLISMATFSPSTQYVSNNEFAPEWTLLGQ